MNSASRATVRLSVLAAAGLLAACGGASPALEDAAKEQQGTGSSAAPRAGTYQESWEGSTVLVNPATDATLAPPCRFREDPICHTYTLSVPASARQVLVAIDGHDEANDFDLYVYDANNVMVAYSATETGNESLVFENTGTGPYEVRVNPWLVVPGSTYAGMAREVSGQPVDSVNDCLEAVPQNVGLAGVSDAGQRVELSVELLLDGTDPVRAAQIMAKAAESYAPLGIDLVVSGMRGVTIQSTVSGEIIQEAKSHSGGRPPEGTDIVAVFTSKEMQGTAGDAATVVGQADCIGGIRWPEHSFAVVTDITASESRQHVPGFYLNTDAASEVMAHELGHLMGAHHHYANCVEGNLSSGGPNDVSPCTLMFNAVNGASLNFSLLEGVAVRGHAVEHAAP
jgi:hypothetical protein